MYQSIGLHLAHDDEISVNTRTGPILIAIYPEAPQSSSTHLSFPDEGGIGLVDRLTVALAEVRAELLRRDAQKLAAVETCGITEPHERHRGCAGVEVAEPWPPIDHDYSDVVERHEHGVMTVETVMHRAPHHDFAARPVSFSLDAGVAGAGDPAGASADAPA